jgi:PKHD-type hydroxylase
MRRLVTNPHSIHNTVYVNSFWIKAFTDKECNRICQHYDTKELSSGTTGTGNDLDHSYRKSNVCLETHNQDNAWIFEKLFNVIEETNEKFFQYDLLGFEFFQYTVYNNTEYYNYHIDTIFNGFEISKDTTLCRKLSVSILLNEPNDFEGGEFDICVGDPNSPVSNKLGKGDAIFFPSYLLHRVRPITQGVRKSLVAWVLGPKWK